MQFIKIIKVYLLKDNKKNHLCQIFINGIILKNTEYNF